MTTSPTAVPLNIFDSEGLAALRYQARRDDPQANRAAAQQFEALMLQMMLKSMRDTVPRQGLFDSEQGRLYESLLDQQLAQTIAVQRGLGLAEIIERQMNQQDVEPQPPKDGVPLNPAPPSSMSLTGVPGRAAPPSRPPLPSPAGNGAPAASAPASAAAAGSATTPRAFAQAMLPYAEQASRITGVPSAFLVAQAALESGWGRSQPRLADGRPSYNLFGIKAGAGWNGPVAEAMTTEIIDGVPQKRIERFRAYASYAEAFADHARLLASSPRYGAVVGSQDAASFAEGLQKAGYATDPRYADKLQRIIAGDTLRSALSG